MHYRALQELSSESVSHNPDILKKVILRKNDVPTLTNFAQAEFQPGQMAPGHRHADMYEIFFVTSGAGEIRINGTSYPLKPGICVTVEPGETHEVHNSSNAVLTLLYFGIQSNLSHQNQPQNN
jgi:mannose-6-phosphate isomerase-like protein (cupin superfamily)